MISVKTLDIFIGNNSIEDKKPQIKFMEMEKLRDKTINAC